MGSPDRADRQLLGRLVETQEFERAALARELHDGPAQALLVSMKLIERAGSRGLDAASCDRLYRQLHAVFDELRRITRGVRPVTLEALGVEQALRRHIEELKSASGLSIDYGCATPDSADRLAESTELALYRVAQEALSNIVRHARASHASVVLVRTGTVARLVVEDNGCGFAPDELHGDSIGLCHMRERAALVGGTCEILSRPGRGTTVRIDAPITPGEV